MIDERKKAIRVTSYFDDFDGNVEKWKMAFYELWRYQLTWEFAYELIIREAREKGVFVDLVIRPAYRETLLDLMYDLGYREIREESENVGLIYYYEHKELEKIDYVYLDY